MKNLKFLISLVSFIMLTSVVYAQNTGILATNLSRFPSTWSVTECCGWTGIWQRRPNTNLFDAQWRHTNGTTASDVLELKSWNNNNEVVFSRQSLNGQYKATYNPSNRTLTYSTTTSYPAGAGWSAVVPLEDEKGKVNLPHR